MEFLHLVREHSFDLLAYLIFGGGLLLELHHAIKAQRVSNHLAIVRDHREIWSLVFKFPNLLGRVENEAVDLSRNPLTSFERHFVNLLLLHLKNSYIAERGRMFFSSEKLALDVRSLFSLPIPRAVWEEVKEFHDSDFIQFVEKSLS